jgi:hypothetical protein
MTSALNYLLATLPPTLHDTLLVGETSNITTLVRYFRGGSLTEFVHEKFTRCDSRLPLFYPQMVMLAVAVASSPANGCEPKVAVLPPRTMAT